MSGQGDTSNKSQQKNAYIFSRVGIKYVVIGGAVQAGCQDCDGKDNVRKDKEFENIPFERYPNQPQTP